MHAMAADMKEMQLIMAATTQSQKEAAQRQEGSLQQLRDEIASLKLAGARVS